MIEKLTSLQNPRIKLLKALREKSMRDQTNQMLIEGKREVLRAAKSGIEIDSLFITNTFVNEDEYLNQINPKETLEVSDDLYEKIAFGNRLEGVLAIANQPQVNLANISLPDNALIVVLEAVEKPGNLGAIMRTCDAAGVDAIILADAKGDIFNPNTIRASLGAIFSVQVVSVSNKEAADFLNQNNFKRFVALVDAKQNYHECNLTSSTAIILGSEDKGLSDFWKTGVNQPFSIPQKGIVDSLNVSVSAGILIYEAMRQRQF